MGKIARYLVLGGWLVAAWSAASGAVIWDRYRGSANLPAMTSPPPGYVNNVTTVSGVTNLLAFAAANAPVDSGSSAQLQWSSGAAQLCNTTASPPVLDACIKRVMGQLTYALVLLPQAGAYTLSVHHDDAVELDTANSTGSPDFRSLVYQTGPQLGSWNNDNDWATLYTPTTTLPNVCLAIRLAWNNNGGPTHLGMAWQGPGIAGPVLVPAANLLDPSVAQSVCVPPLDAVDDSAVISPTTPALTIDVLGNDVAGLASGIDPASLALVDPPAVGSVSCSAGACAYTAPPGGLFGLTSFTYRVCLAAPDSGICDVATVTIRGGNHAVPTLGPWALAVLAFVLGLLAVTRQRWRRS